MRADEAVFAATSPGLEPVLEGEGRLRGWQARAVPGGVELSGPPGLHREANLLLRTANRVWLRLGQFDAGSPAELRAGLGALDLTPYWERRMALALGVTAPGGPGAWVEQAVRDALRPHVLRRFSEEQAEAGQGLSVRLEPGPGRRWRCTVSLDTSGELLFRRGYRQEVSRAPLRETLAAGMLGLAGYDGQVPLWDPMCGSGTLLLEAAWMALGRAPGALRTFAFEKWPSFRAAEWETRKAEARAAERTQVPVLGGSDLNAGALGTARRNARRALVQERVSLVRSDVATLKPPEAPPGLLVVNPPYGIRVGERGELGTLYRALGATVRGAFAAWHWAVLVPDARWGAALGLSPRARHAVNNGGIRCELWVGEPCCGRAEASIARGPSAAPQPGLNRDPDADHHDEPGKSPPKPRG